MPETETTERARVVSPCGAVDLLAAIFGEDRDKLRKHYHLPLPSAVCKQCGGHAHSWSHIYQKDGVCSAVCRRQYNLIKVACDECGKLFERDARLLIHQVSKDRQQHVFCNRHCFGHWVARHYGFGERKWDWDMVWAKHLETGLGAVRLSRILGIPCKTIDAILVKKRKEIRYARRESEGKNC